MMLMLRRVLLYASMLLTVVPLAAQIDVSTIGPRVGAVVPDFQGVDQFGARQTLQSTLGPKGAMLVFFRSADW